MKIKRFINGPVFERKPVFFIKWVSVLMIFVIISEILFPVHSNAAERLLRISDPVVIVLDPGHGGSDNGTMSGTYLEKHLDMYTCVVIKQYLSQFDNCVVYLTHEADVDMNFKQRADFAASVNADILLSVHYNASVDHDLYGAESWVSLFPPYNAYGYQFADIWLKTAAETGIFLRGIKTKPKSDGRDYYGIIRENVERGVFPVIIEHCHIDNAKDASYCDEEADWRKWGELDAQALAKYFGLRSTALGVDYSSFAYQLADADPAAIQPFTKRDDSDPDFCNITHKSTDYDQHILTLTVTGADYDSPLMYYDYSLDGGMTYTERKIWPGFNALNWTYDESFDINLEFNDGDKPDIIVRAYNIYDRRTESSVLSFDTPLSKPMPGPEPGEDPEPEENITDTTTESPKETHAENTEITKDETIGGEAGLSEFMDDLKKEKAGKESEAALEIKQFLSIILFMLVSISVLIAAIALFRKNRRRRR